MKNMRGRFRRFWSDMRLERKLLVSYILFAVIPILVIGTVICRVSFKIIMRQTRQYADMMIERINNDADAFVENIERQAYVVYTEPEIQDILEHADRYTFSQLQDGKEMIHKRLIGMWVTEKYIVGSYLCGAEGNSYYTNINERNDIDPAQVFSGESWYATITEGARKGVLTGVHRDDKYSDSSSLQLISYVHAVNSIGTGKYLGFLVIDIDARVLGEIVGNRAENLGGYITILDNENNVMNTTLPEETGHLGQVICMEHVSPGTGWTVCQGDREHYAAHRSGGGIVLPGVHLAVPEDFAEHQRADPGPADRHGPGGGGRHGGGGAGGPGRRDREAGRKLQPHGFQY